MTIKGFVNGDFELALEKKSHLNLKYFIPLAMIIFNIIEESGYMNENDDKLVVGLFITCLVDIFRPKIGFDAIELCEKAGFKVIVPDNQICCGQPAFNSGDSANAKKIAMQCVAMFADCDYVVVPSGSCAGMMIKHFVELFDDNDEFMQDILKFSQKTWEITDFLVNIAKITLPEQDKKQQITYHDSCSGLRELGIKHQPRKLLKDSGHEINELNQSEECCGFGGMFCVKYPEISNEITTKKTANVKKSKAEILCAGDLGCLMTMAGKLHRDGEKTACYHVIELLNNTADKPIGAQ